jgi:hypothetical protein
LGHRKGEEAKTILNIILTDDYTFTGPGGAVLTKSEYLKQVSGRASFRTEDVESAGMARPHLSPEVSIWNMLMG